MDNKHAVFGKIVGGLDTLNSIEKIEVDNKDRPIEDIIVQTVQIFVDPFEEVHEQLIKERAEEKERLIKEAAEAKIPKRKKDETMKVYRTGVGKYIKTVKAEDEKNVPAVVPKKKKKLTSSTNAFTFSTW